MRHIRNITICLIVLAGMVSCKTTQSAYTLRSGKSIDIQSNIVQMPAVADLVVDTTYVTADTTWQNTFGHTVMKKDMRKVLIGKMMEETKADVIIEPHEQVVSQQEKAFKKNYQMTISGYPARFRHFRTATLEDLRILNGLQPPTVNKNIIYLGGGYDGKRLMGTDNISPLFRTKKKNSRNNKDWRAEDGRKKYHGTLDVGYVCSWQGVDSPEPFGHGVNINWSNLWLVSRHTMLGIGAKANGLFLKESENDMTTKGQLWMLHFYFNPRFYFSRTKVAPFFDMRAGAGLSLEKEETTDSKYSSSSTNYSLYGALRLGLSIGKHLDISIGTDIMTVEIDDLYETLTISAGFTF